MQRAFCQGLDRFNQTLTENHALDYKVHRGAEKMLVIYNC